MVCIAKLALSTKTKGSCDHRWAKVRVKKDETGNASGFTEEMSNKQWTERRQRMQINSLYAAGKNVCL